MLRYLVIVPLVLLLSGCGILSKYFQDEDSLLVRIGAMTGSLHSDYSTLDGLVEDILASGHITEEGKATLKSVRDRAKPIIDVFDEIKDGKQLSDTELYNLYAKIKVLYLEGRPILEYYYKNSGEDPSKFILEFDEEAKKLDRLVSSAEQSYNTKTTAVNGLYAFITNVLRIVIAAAVTAL